MSEEKTLEKRLKERGGVRHEDGTISTPLKYPVKAEGLEINDVTLRRVSVDDLERVDRERGGLGKSKKMISLLAELSPDQVGKMDAADFNFLSEVVDSFLE